MRGWDQETDVVIAGAGGAGLNAALACVEHGADAVVVEKQARIWDSSTANAVARVAFFGTGEQQRNGVQDSREQFLQDAMAAAQGVADPAMLEAYADHQLETYRKLCDLGIRWSPTVSVVAGMSVARGHLTDGLDLVRTLRRSAETKGAQVRFRTPLLELVAEDGRVTGAVVQERSGRAARIRARRGVVLASGGFARDAERLAKLDPALARVAPTSGPGHTGDGHRMAEALGAALRDVEHVKPSFELHTHGDCIDDYLILYYSGAIIVNREGRRYVNESLDYKNLGRAVLDQPGCMGFQVFDRDIHDRAVKAYRAAGRGSSITLDPGRERMLLRGDTPEALAASIDIPPAVLRETIDRYNAGVERGEDPDFGRQTLAGFFGKPVKLQRPPFFAFPTISHLLATYAGLVVDREMRVLANGRPIPGLYAAGEIVGGFHGSGYQSGTAVGKALVFGRIAGASAAARR